MRQLVEKITLEGSRLDFNKDNKVIHAGMLHGILRNNGFIKIHNRIYEQRIYQYMTVNLQIENLLRHKIEHEATPENFMKQDGSLDFEQVLLKFQQFMKEQASAKDSDFLERNGRLLFLSFLRPILNGKGFDFKEVEISEEKRLDVVVTFLDKKYVVELKLWRGPQKHRQGLQQLSDYLERYSLEQGYLVIFDLRTGPNKEWKTEHTAVNRKQIFAVWV